MLSSAAHNGIVFHLANGERQSAFVLANSQQKCCRFESIVSSAERILFISNFGGLSSSSRKLASDNSSGGRTDGRTNVLQRASPWPNVCLTVDSSVRFLLTIRIDEATAWSVRLLHISPLCAAQRRRLLIDSHGEEATICSAKISSSSSSSTLEA